MSKILVCPVAFNEKIKLENVIKRYLASKVSEMTDYLIVDDGSTDGTSEMIVHYAPSGVNTIRHASQRGVGSAIRTAIVYAREQQYDVLVIMAGNDKDNPDEIPLLLEPILQEDYDFVQGSRHLRRDGMGGDMPYYRKLATRLHPWLMSVATGKKLTDTTNGFRAFKLSVFENPGVNIHQQWLDHYELEPYILYKTVKLGFRFKEVGVTKIYPPKKLGYTKMKPITGWWSILRPVFLLALGIKK